MIGHTKSVFKHEAAEQDIESWRDHITYQTRPDIRSVTQTAVELMLICFTFTGPEGYISIHCLHYVKKTNWMDNSKATETSEDNMFREVL